MWMTFLVLVISTISTILNFFLLKIPTQTKEQDTKKILLTCTVLTTTGKKANNKDQNQKFSANATYPAIGKRSQGVLFFPKYYWIFLEFNFTTFMFLDMSGSNCDPQGECSTSTQLICIQLCCTNSPVSIEQCFLVKNSRTHPSQKS